MQRMNGYQHQTSTQTLQEGIEEYTSVFSEQLTQRTLSAEGTSLFRCHDVIHVVFGCGLTLEDEMIVKLCSFLGSTGGRHVFAFYRLPESKEIYDQINVRQIARTALQTLVVVPKTLVICMKMKARWPWNDFEHFLEKPLCELRGEFGINVPHSTPD